MGLFHFANSYRRAADALGTMKSDATHPDAPRSFLYFHAIELYLKAFLRHHDHTVGELQKLRHGFGQLTQLFDDRGGFLEDEDRDVLEIMDKTSSVIRSRYIETGYFERPSIEGLARTTSSLHGTVRSALRKAGRSVR